jgi:predicted TIM-barrel fold metal-dependent hydrolase
MTIVAAHMGGYDCWNDVERYLVGRDLYFDTSYSLRDLGPERMTALIKAHSTDKILFGTDSPWTDQSAEVAAIRALPLADDEIAAVLGGNAVRMLGIPDR